MGWEEKLEGRRRGGWEGWEGLEEGWEKDEETIRTYLDRPVNVSPLGLLHQLHVLRAGC